MTIKNRGGVFGRNPTFNDVDVDGTLSIGGSSIPAPANTATYDASPAAFENTITANGLTIGSSTQSNTVVEIKSANNTTAGLDMFGDLGAAKGFRVKYEGNGNYFVIEDNTSAVLTERLRIDGTGHVKVTTGNLIIGTSGKGIDFSATAGTGTSELLSDYEEGSFTPVFADASSSGNEASAGSAYGYYTKIGRQVFITLELANVNTSGLTAGNDIFITGLPFAPASLTGDIRHSGTFTMTQVSVVGTDIINVAEIRDNLNYLKFRQSTSGDFLTVGEVTSGTADFYVSLTYIA